MTEKKENARVNGKIYFTGKLVFNESFVSVSSGNGNESTDSLVYRDSDGKLIIPATSFTGVLRQELETLFKEEKKELDRLFGNNNKDNKEEQKCSDFVFTDLYADRNEKAAGTYVQQGVRMSRHYLAAEDKGKFDREIALDQTFPFYFYLEKTREDTEYYHAWIKRLAVVFNNKRPFFVGGRNSVGNGWGQFKDVKYLDYDFSQPQKLEDFLLREGTEEQFVNALIDNNNHSLTEADIDTMGKNIIQLDYTVKFKDALLINDPDAEPDDREADFNFLKINGKPIIPGSSIKGVFRSRSEMIANTMGIDEQKIKEVFGNTEAKSKIYFSYGFIDTEHQENPGQKLINSVSIDRFTGGAAEAALFDFNLLMKETFKGRIIIELSKDTLWFPGLLHLVMRDIREGDLSFGFGRTKGWGKAASFEYNITLKCVTPGWEKYVKNDMFNLDELESHYISVLNTGERK
jgi:CRISPR/Cas system CSM-associated protein Csm3 (group 7 of RAMP superfamily)